MTYKIKFTGLALAVALLTTGCNAIKEYGNRAVPVTCESVATSLELITVYNEKLPLTALERVNTVREVVAPICTSPEQPKLTDVQRKFLELGSKELANIVEEHLK